MGSTQSNAGNAGQEEARSTAMELLLEPIVERLIGRALDVHQAVYSLNREQIVDIVREILAERDQRTQTQTQMQMMELQKAYYQKYADMQNDRDYKSIFGGVDTTSPTRTSSGTQQEQQLGSFEVKRTFFQKIYDSIK